MSKSKAIRAYSQIEYKSRDNKREKTKARDKARKAKAIRRAVESDQ